MRYYPSQNASHAEQSQSTTLHQPARTIFFVFFLLLIVAMVGDHHAPVTPPVEIAPDRHFRRHQILVNVRGRRRLLTALLLVQNVPSRLHDLFQLADLLLFRRLGGGQDGMQVLQERVQIGRQRAQAGSHVQQVLSGLTGGEFLRQDLTVRGALCAQLFGFGFQRGIGHGCRGVVVAIVLITSTTTITAVGAIPFGVSVGGERHAGWLMLLNSTSVANSVKIALPATFACRALLSDTNSDTSTLC